MKTSLILIAAVIFISGCTSQTTASTNSNATAGIDVGNRAPDFAVAITNGSTMRLSELHKPLVLYFMATWCPYCNEEYKVMGKLYPQYPGVELLSMSIDPNDSRQMLQEYKIKGRPGLFAQSNQDVLSNYNVVTTTTKYVIDRDGIIIYRGIGPLAEENWKTIFDAVTQ